MNNAFLTTDGGILSLERQIEPIMYYPFQYEGSMTVLGHFVHCISHWFSLHHVLCRNFELSFISETLQLYEASFVSSRPAFFCLSPLSSLFASFSLLCGFPSVTSCWLMYDSLSLQSAPRPEIEQPSKQKREFRRNDIQKLTFFFWRLLLQKQDLYRPSFLENRSYVLWFGLLWISLTEPLVIHIRHVKKTDLWKGNQFISMPSFESFPQTVRPPRRNRMHMAQQHVKRSHTITP
jgi:hypothetical protein